MLKTYNQISITQEIKHLGECKVIDPEDGRESVTRAKVLKLETPYKNVEC